MRLNINTSFCYHHLNWGTIHSCTQMGLTRNQLGSKNDPQWLFTKHIQRSATSQETMLQYRNWQLEDTAGRIHTDGMNTPSGDPATSASTLLGKAMVCKAICLVADKVWWQLWQMSSHFVSYQRAKSWAEGTASHLTWLHVIPVHLNGLCHGDWTKVGSLSHWGTKFPPNQPLHAEMTNSWKVALFVDQHSLRKAIIARVP